MAPILITTFFSSPRKPDIRCSEKTAAAVNSIGSLSSVSIYLEREAVRSHNVIFQLEIAKEIVVVVIWEHYSEIGDDKAFS